MRRVRPSTLDRVVPALAPALAVLLFVQPSQAMDPSKLDLTAVGQVSGAIADSVSRSRGDPGGPVQPEAEARVAPGSVEIGGHSGSASVGPNGFLDQGSLARKTSQPIVTTQPYLLNPPGQLSGARRSVEQHLQRQQWQAVELKDQLRRQQQQAAEVLARNRRMAGWQQSQRDLSAGRDLAAKAAVASQNMSHRRYGPHRQVTRIERDFARQSYRNDSLRQSRRHLERTLENARDTRDWAWNLAKTMTDLQLERADQAYGMFTSVWAVGIPLGLREKALTSIKVIGDTGRRIHRMGRTLVGHHDSISITDDVTKGPVSNWDRYKFTK